MRNRHLILPVAVFTQFITAQSLKVGNESISVAEFAKEYETGLKNQGVESTIDSYINYRIAQEFAKNKQVDTMRYFKSAVVQRLSELKKNDYFPKPLQDKFLTQYIADNKREYEVQVFFVNKEDGEKKDFQKIYNEVKSGALTMEKAIEENTKEDASPIFIKAGSLNWELDQEVHNLRGGEYSTLMNNDQYATFIKKIGERPSLGYLMFGAISYPNDSNAAAKKDSIYTALKSGESFQEVAKKFGSTPNEKQNGGAVMGSPVLPNDIYELMKTLKSGDYAKDAQLNGDKWYVFNLYAKRPYDISTPENREFFMADMMNSQYGNRFYEEFLSQLKKSSLYKETPTAEKIKDSYVAFQKITNDKELLYSYNNQSFTIGDFKAQIEKHLDKVATMENLQWKNLVETINNNFLMSQYTMAYENKPEVKNEIDALKRNLHSDYFYSQYIIKKIKDSPELLTQFYNSHKDRYVKEAAAKGRVIIPINESDIAKFSELIKNKSNWEKLKAEYKDKKTANGEAVAVFHEGEMIESAEVFQKYKVPFKTGIYTAKIGNRTLIMANDEMIPGGQMTQEEALEFGGLKDDVTSDLVRKTIEEQKSKTKIEIDPKFISALEKNFKK